MPRQQDVDPFLRPQRVHFRSQTPREGNRVPRAARRNTGRQLRTSLHATPGQHDRSPGSTGWACPPGRAANCPRRAVDIDGEDARAQGAPKLSCRVACPRPRPCPHPPAGRSSAAVHRPPVRPRPCGLPYSADQACNTHSNTVVPRHGISSFGPPIRRLFPAAGITPKTSLTGSSGHAVPALCGGSTRVEWLRAKIGFAWPNVHPYFHAATALETNNSHLIISTLRLPHPSFRPWTFDIRHCANGSRCPSARLCRPWPVSRCPSGCSCVLAGGCAASTNSPLTPVAACAPGTWPARFRWATSSAQMLTAISGTVCEPIWMPSGA